MTAMTAMTAMAGLGHHAPPPCSAPLGFFKVPLTSTNQRLPDQTCSRRAFGSSTAQYSGSGDGIHPRQMPRHGRFTSMPGDAGPTTFTWPASAKRPPSSVFEEHRLDSTVKATGLPDLDETNEMWWAKV
ncbi:hypothetical protein E4U43_005472 [Claviceps pusilla]|uniref:Uncharacterized protein n=1 Tax=Claviceps pusilla TaxID=123648 RepID=A0A9P7N214_9HYPO|nr:hypothetical protein E4U43_005472 [Claviceps pusilla]